MINADLIYNAIWEQEEQELAIQNMTELEAENKENGYTIPSNDMLFGDDILGVNDVLEETELDIGMDF